MAVLTYNRIKALTGFINGLDLYCPSCPRAIFDDNSFRDNTPQVLKISRTSEPTYHHDWLSDRFAAKFSVNGPEWSVFMSTRNLGVASSSNKAIRWFMEETTADHLCLCNDDLIIEGDFVKFYAMAHEKLKIHHFAFCDFNSDTYKWVPIKVKAADSSDWTLKLLPRMTGIMMSMTREMVNRIGYYDASFGKWGEEHSDWTNRARFAGGMRLQERDLHCLDVDTGTPPLLRHLEIESTISPLERPHHDAVARTAITRASKLYICTDWHRQFKLHQPQFAGAYEASGVAVNQLNGYPLVIE